MKFALYKVSTILFSAYKFEYTFTLIHVLVEATWIGLKFYILFKVFELKFRILYLLILELLMTPLKNI